MVGINGSVSSLLNNYYGLKTRPSAKNGEAENAEGEKSADKSANPGNAEAPKDTAAKEKKNGSANQRLKEQLADMKEKVAARPAAAEKEKSSKEVAEPAGSGVTAAASEEETAGQLSFMDKLKEMQAGFADQLLKAMGIGSMNENGKGANISAAAISAQYSLNISTTMSLINRDGSMSTSTFNFSLEASFDYLGIASGKGSGASSLSSLFDIKSNSSSLSGDSFIDQLREMFSPENTAQRILDFSLSFYGKSSMYKEAGGDTEEARSSFADYIGAAIQKGFDQAMGILGNSINDTTSKEIDQTHQLVFDGLNDFVNELSEARKDKEKTGEPADKAQSPISGYDSAKNGLYGNLQYFASSLSISYSSSSTYYRADEARQMRPAAGNPYAAAVSGNNVPENTGNSAVSGDALNMTV